MSYDCSHIFFTKYPPVISAADICIVSVPANAVAEEMPASKREKVSLVIS
jgi:hypothetical protein